MSRKKRDYRRRISPDPKFNSPVLAKFVNKVMLGGKKSVAQRVVYEALDLLAKETGENQLRAFEIVLKNVRPLMEVRSRRVGGSTYQVPVEVKPDRSVALAVRWIINNSRSRSGMSFVDALSKELIDSYKNTGASIKKREDTHKMAEANKAFAHFKW